MGKVTCRFLGRLGNNMFQAAAVIGYAKKHGLNWFIPHVNKESPRFYEFFPELPTGTGMLNPYNCHDPSMFNFQNIPYFNNGTCLTGFFQSEKYFKHCEEDIKRYFKLNIKEGFDECVSIHVRRGDYVRYSTDFPPITMDYIHQAMERFPDRKFLVFSDDVEWCKRMMPYNCEFPMGDEYYDLSLMASCGDHIIANSTFSWWGAWLGSNPDRRVITPHHTSWFGPANGVKSPPVDLLPDNWEQIKFR